MTNEEIAKQKEYIDKMTQTDMAHLWRFAPAEHLFFDKRLPLWKHFDKRFKELGGFTPGISKALG